MTTWRVMGVNASSPAGDATAGAPATTLLASSLNLRPVDAGVGGLLPPAEAEEEGAGKGILPDAVDRVGDGTGAIDDPTGGVGAVTFIVGITERSTLF